MKITFPFILLLITLMFSCTIAPEQINYGNEACHFCKMTIVDRQHAAEAVTTKGKIYKYDASECMINDLNQKKDIKMAMLLVNDYSNPGELVSVTSSIFLISKGVKSPMGANLTAFSDLKLAEKVVSQRGGNLYNWEQVKDQIK